MAMKEIMERLDAYMRSKGINDRQMSFKCGLAQGVLSKARAGRNDIGKKSVERILKACPDLSRQWLLSGYGEMVVETSVEKVDIGDGKIGDNSTYTSNDTKVIERALDEIAAERKMVQDLAAALRESHDQIMELSRLIAQSSGKGQSNG